jgi:hypothetical protein
MDWCETFEPHLEVWHADPDQAHATGSHDGFARLADGVTHRRTVWRRRGGYVVLLDEFEGSGTHDIDLTYQFAPGEACLEDGRLVFRDEFELVWHSLAAPVAQLYKGGARPDQGWIAPSLGIKVPAPRLDLRVTFVPPRTVVLSVLADMRVTKGRPRVRRADSTAGGERFTVDCDGWIDSIEMPNGGDSLRVGTKPGSGETLTPLVNPSHVV